MSISSETKPREAYCRLTKKSVAFGTGMRLSILTSLSIFDLAVRAATKEAGRAFDVTSCVLEAGLIPPLLDKSPTIPQQSDSTSNQAAGHPPNRPRHRIALTGPGPNAILSLHLMVQRLQEQDGVDRREELVSILNNAMSCEIMLNSLRALLELKSEILPAENVH